MIFEEKYFSCYILLTDQILLSPCLYFMAWLSLLLEILGVIIFVHVCDVISFLKLTLAFLSSRFSIWPKKSGQKCKYAKNQKSYEHEIKSVFHDFWRVFIESSITFFGSPTLSVLLSVNWNPRVHIPLKKKKSYEITVSQNFVDFHEARSQLISEIHSFT